MLLAYKYGQNHIEVIGVRKGLYLYLRLTGIIPSLQEIAIFSMKYY